MSHLTRRRFLEDSLLAAAAAATAGSTVARAASEDQPKKASANETLSVAVVGVHGRGSDHLGGFIGLPDTEVTHICDADEAVGRKRCEEVGKRQKRKPEFVRDVREIMNNKSIDIVSTATPNHWHALISIWAMQAGKDVYVEKPVSHNVSEGRRIVEAARKYHKICQTGTQCRSHKTNQDVMAYLHGGKLGKVKVARGLCYKRRKSIGERGAYDPPKSVDYDLWCGPAPMDPLTRPNLHYDWHWQWRCGNGDLGNQGIHQMDLARWGLQADGLSKGVFSYGGRFGYVDAGDTANTQVVVHDYGDRALAFEVRGLETKPHKGANVGVVFECENGYVVLTAYDRGAAFDERGHVVEKFDGGGNHYANFLAAVKSRQSGDLNADILEGHLSSALCHLGNISYRLGEEMKPGEAKEKIDAVKSADSMAETFARFSEHLADNKVSLSETPVRVGALLAIDSEKETFIGSSAADEMLTRDYRKPFVVPKTADL
jgi:predicted dehydrogenase